MNAPISYAIDHEAAQKAGGPARIDETRVYRGIFTEAKHLTARSGTTGIEFSFKDTETEATVRFLSLYTHRKDGSIITVGFNTVQSILAALGVGGVSWSEGLDEQKQRAFFAHDLTNKPISVLLQVDLYSKADGSDGQSMNLVMVGDGQTGQTPKEKASSEAATALQRRAQLIGDSDRREAPPQQQHAYSQPAHANGAGTAVVFDDSMPF